MAKNEFQFSGNLTKDAETKTYTYQGKEQSYVSLTVALNHPRKKDVKAKFIEVQFRDKYQAEIAAKQAKGDKVLVRGEFTWDVGQKGDFLKLENASFAPGWLPPKKEDAMPAPSVPAAEGIDDFLM